MLEFRILTSSEDKHYGIPFPFNDKSSALIYTSNSSEYAFIMSGMGDISDSHIYCELYIHDRIYYSSVKSKSVAIEAFSNIKSVLDNRLKLGLSIDYLGRILYFRYFKY